MADKVGKVRLDFIVNGQEQQLLCEPRQTLLEILREELQMTGTKEGCAEGDCGACTLVLGSLTVDDTIKYCSFDSCLVFIPMLHGKELVTVECIGDSTNLPKHY